MSGGKSIRKTILFPAVIIAVIAASSLTAGEETTFSREITSDTQEFIIDVPGTLDPRNIEITIENLGSTPVVDPRLTVNGLYDWYDLKSIAAEATRGCTTDREKALAIYEWILFKRYQLSPRDRSAQHPVRGANGYGYVICGHCSSWLQALCEEVGVKTRVQELWGHTVNEVYYDSQWHLLDSNVKVYYLAEDNRTIASLADLEHNRQLIERTLHSHDPWVRQPDSLARNNIFVNYICSYADNYIDESEGRLGEIRKDYTMSYTLKQGEKLVRWWGPELGKYEAGQRREPEVYANGQLIWEPDLDKVDVLPYLRVIDNVTTTHQDGRKPAIHCARLQNYNLSRPSRFTIPVSSPYPIVGGSLYCTLIKEGDSGNFLDKGWSLDYAGVGYGPPDFWASNLGRFRRGKGSLEVTAQLDSFMVREQPLYDYEIGFSISGNADATPPTESGVSRFKVVTDLQVSPHSLPALSRGRNVIKYWDKSPEPGKRVRITWKVRTVEDNNPPGRVAAAVSPGNGEVVSSLTPVLKWKPAVDIDKDDRIEDYQVMISLYPECRWPLAMALHQNVGAPVAEWAVPGSFLNPGTVYYWKVRARDSREAIGEWSEVFSFTTSPEIE